MRLLSFEKTVLKLRLWIAAEQNTTYIETGTDQLICEN